MSESYLRLTLPVFITSQHHWKLLPLKSNNYNGEQLATCMIFLLFCSSESYVLAMYARPKNRKVLTVALKLKT
jgi:hypothetical protein